MALIELDPPGTLPRDQWVVQFAVPCPAFLFRDLGEFVYQRNGEWNAALREPTPRLTLRIFTSAAPESAGLSLSALSG